MAAQEADVVLYGATGYTGRLIAQALADQDADVVLAGRSRGKLESLADELDAGFEVATASVDDHEALVSLARRAPVMVTAAGPFEALGPPVVRACMEAGTHLADITGEQTYLRWCWEHAHEDAKAAGITVANALGFDVVPSDIASVAAAEPLEEIARLDLCIATRASLSAGTKRTMAQSGGRGWWFDHGTYHAGPPGRFARQVTFPDHDRAPTGDRTGVFIPWGDVATAHRSTGADVVRTFFVTAPKTARRMHLAWPLTALVSKVGPLRSLLAQQAPPPGKGPSEQERERATFAILAEAAGTDGSLHRALVTGRDPYGLTGQAAARGSLALARGEVDRSGVVTPTQLFETQRWLKELAAFELEVQHLED